MISVAAGGTPASHGEADKKGLMGGTAAAAAST
jgi:hypothetical protein